MNTTTTKFCPVCKNAGKSKEEYTSHFVRASPEPDAEVVCPTLLNTICTNCGEKGHTQKHCKIQRKREKYERFCIVCKNTGKSKEEYTSHFVRASPEPDAEIICPTLLNTCCEYCSEYGHTISYCKIYKQEKKEETENSKDNVSEKQHNDPYTEYKLYLERNYGIEAILKRKPNPLYGDWDKMLMT